MVRENRVSLCTITDLPRLQVKYSSLYTVVGRERVAFQCPMALAQALRNCAIVLTMDPVLDIILEGRIVGTGYDLRQPSVVCVVYGIKIVAKKG